MVSELFQFTHPGRGATKARHRWRGREEFQFTHPGRGATVKDDKCMCLEFLFQFTHPGRGATSRGAGGIRRTGGFNSRTPGGVRPRALGLPHPALVLIHAPREGCDRQRLRRLWGGEEVSIHAPREGCDGNRSNNNNGTKPFQFTHPGRGATVRSPLLQL